MDSTGKFNTLFDEIVSIHFLAIQEGFGLCSTILMIILLIWTCLQFDDYKKALTISSKMKIFTVLTIISYLIMSVISAIFINNLITNYISHELCQIVYIIYFITYNIGNIGMYLIMSYHIQSIFPSNINQQLSISTYSMNVYRYLCLLIPNILWAFYLYLAFDHISILNIDEYKYQYCYAQQFNHSFLAQITLISIGIFHIFFILFILFTIVFKSINNSSIILQEMSWKKHAFIKKLSVFIRKTTILCIISIISTVLLIFCSAYIWQQSIFFLVIDALINGYCVICLLEFGDKLYVKTCKKMEKCCDCIYCLDKQLLRSSIWKKYDKVNDLNGKKSINGYRPPIQEQIDSDTGFLLTNSITITGNESNESITPLTGFSNISPHIPGVDEEEKKEDSLIMLHNTNSSNCVANSSGVITELELQSTIS